MGRDVIGSACMDLRLDGSVIVYLRVVKESLQVV